MKTKNKKILAREILFLFGTILLIGLFYLGIIFWNHQIKKSINKTQEKINQLNADILPPLYLAFIYNDIKGKMVINFQVDNDVYAIPYIEVSSFLNDFPNAIKLDNYEKRYSFFKKQNDSILTFDLVEFDEFRTLMVDSSYCNELFDFASKEIDLGSRRKYLEEVKEDLEFKEITPSERTKIDNVLEKLESKVELKSERIIENENIKYFTVIFSFILTGLLYPIRFIIIALKWSINTLKNN